MTDKEQERIVENAFTVTSDDLYEVFSRRAWVSAGTIVPIVAALLAISYAITFSAISKTYQTVIIAALFLIFFVYWLINRFYVVRVNVKRNTARMNELGVGRMVSALYDDRLELRSEDGRFTFSVPYDKVKKVVRSKNLIAVCTASNMLLFKKDCYTVGDSRILIKQLKIKCGRLRFYGFPKLKND